MSAFPRLVVAVSVLALVASCAPAGPAKEAAPTDPVRAGLLLFNDPSLSGDGTWACASCHPRGGHTDNRTYVGTGIVPDGQPDGRSVPLLWGVKDTAPYSWAGGKTLHDTIKGIIVNRMKGKEPAPEQLDALAAYLGSLEFPNNPNLNPDGSPSNAAPVAAKRGWQVFQRASCNICHVPPVFAKADNEDIGSGGSFNVPSLRGLPSTAPYFHDGRFPDLRALLPAKIDYLRKLGSTEKFGDQDLEDLLAYLDTL
ncbi:MAG: cytochrome c peroxidase [Candidatus Polarisedimenticolia bacterium]